MCDFCKIIRKELPAHIVYENNNLISFLDIDPISEGHVLIVPKEHTNSIENLSEKVLADIMNVAKDILVALKEIYEIDGYSIMQNGGKFCDYGHAHFHLFPRYENDGFGWKYPEGGAEYSAGVAKKLRDKVMKITYHNVEDVNDEDIKIAVIVAKHKGKIVLCKHKERDTWEMPGGHREAGETVIEAAKRELYEETGANKFTITPICVYHITKYALLCYAEIEEFDKLPESEMECVQLFDALPDNMTYPTTHPDLYAKAMEMYGSKS